jgi:uncharacterized protein YeaO (DUF488 family)
MFKIKRVYTAAGPADGYRVLVDRLWPRGVSKEKAHVDLWMKQIGPSDRLRKWFGHDPARWSEFQKRYRAELREKSDLTKELKRLEKQRRTVTLVYSAHDELHNQAVALSAFLQRRSPNKVR